MAITLIGGSSMPGQISILSNQFRSTAQYQSDGTIDCRVVPLPALTRYLYAHPSLPIPRLARLALFLVAGISWRTAAKFLVAVLAGIGLTWAVLAKLDLPRTQTAGAIRLALLGQSVLPCLITGIVLIPLLFSMHRYVATWHGAEHMAIVGYENAGAVEVSEFSRESPVADKCGGRLMLPLLLIPLLSSAVTVVLSFLSDRPSALLAVTQLLIELGGLEAALWIDKLWGFDKLPVFSRASRWLQRRFTTKPPGQAELRTAEAALQRLIAAHQAA